MTDGYALQRRYSSLVALIARDNSDIEHECAIIDALDRCGQNEAADRIRSGLKRIERVLAAHAGEKAELEKKLAGAAPR